MPVSRKSSRRGADLFLFQTKSDNGHHSHEQSWSLAQCEKPWTRPPPHTTLANPLAASTTTTLNFYDSSDCIGYIWIGFSSSQAFSVSDA